MRTIPKNDKLYQYLFLLLIFAIIAGVIAWLGQEYFNPIYFVGAPYMLVPFLCACIVEKGKVRRMFSEYHLKLEKRYVGQALKYVVYTGVAFVVICSSCSNTKYDQGEILTIDVRELLNSGTQKNGFIADEIDSVEYISLETTQDGASLIGGILDYTVTDSYIYILPMKENKIMQFDRKGHFIKNVVTYGEGPGEYNGFPQNIYADDIGNRLYIANMDKTWVYTLSGEFIGIRQRKNMISYEYKIADDRYAGISYLNVPFHIPGIFGIGIFSEKEDTVAIKNDFLSVDNVPAEVSGFTNVSVAWNQNNVLFKTVSNDTVFRLVEDTIVPAYILQLKNSKREIIRGLKVRNDDGASSDDIWGWDMFETRTYFYFRFVLDNEFYIVAVNRLTGESSIERCSMPTDDIYQLIQLNRLLGLVGVKFSKLETPFWGCRFGDNLVQIITAPEWLYFKEKGYVKGMDYLAEDDNPVFIFYKLKR